jgi:transposase
VSKASASELPDDVQALKTLLLAERARSSGLDAKIAQLEHTVHLFSKWLWGPRTEKRAAEVTPAPGQGHLPFVELLEAAQRVADRHGAQGSLEITPPQAPPPKTKPRREFPAHLPVARTVIDVPEAERICCGQPMAPMGEDVTRELERIELAIVHEIARKKYCCRLCQEHVLTAVAPTRALDKALLGSGWLSTLLVERFGNHMPYNRLEKKYESEGVALSRTILCRSACDLGERFEPVYEALCGELAADDVLFADETGVVVQESSSGGRKNAQVWLYANKHGDCVFDYNESRGRASPERMLRTFTGYLHDDGYIVYETALDPARVQHVGCWAHVRRYFVDAEKTDPVLAKEAVEQIRKLYELERKAKEAGLTLDEVRAQREELAPEILARFKEWLDVRATQVLPQSPMAKAIQYTLGRWEALGRFVHDGRLELDNNRAERALRQVAVGRKNWMQIGNERGGRTASVFYSLITTCKQRGIDPRTYLRDVMLRLKEGVDPKTLTPREWLARYAAEVAERRDYVLAQVLAKLGA